MFAGTKNLTLATTITGSLPRPDWFNQDLRGRAFHVALSGDPIFREQYLDAVAAVVMDQSRAGLDILSDGEMRFDRDVGGRSWYGYIFERIEGLSPVAPTAGPLTKAATDAFSRIVQKPGGPQPGDITYDFANAKQPPRITGSIAAGPLQYGLLFRVAQQMTSRPIKMGSCSAQMIDRQVLSGFYQDRRERLRAISEALNSEHRRLAAAGCPIIQIEEPCLHSVPSGSDGLSLDDYVDALNIEVTAGARRSAPRTRTGSSAAATT